MSFGSNTDKSVSLMSPSLEKRGVCCSVGAPHPGCGVSDEHCGDGGKNRGYSILKFIPKFSHHQIYQRIGM